MSITLEVEIEATVSGSQLLVSGADATLGGWDLNRALRLNSTEDPRKWSVELPVAVGGTEFKFALAQASGEPAWEPLQENRRFPSHGFGDGSRLLTQFGQPRMTVEAGAAHIEANAKGFRKLEERQGSALQVNVDSKGENAYYYAHTRKFEVPEHAKVITGPGLITGGQPVLLEAGAALVTADEATVNLKDYSWADSNGKVKVYVPVPEGLLPAEGADSLVEASFEVSQVDLTIKTKPRQRLRIEKLNGELKVEACSTRVEVHKNRIVLQLAKKRDTTWYSLTKK